MALHRVKVPKTVSAPVVGLLGSIALVGCPAPTPTDAGVDTGQADRVIPADQPTPDTIVTDTGVDTGVEVDSGLPDSTVVDVPDAAVGPDPLPSTISRAIECGAACRGPLDVVLDSTGTTAFFTAFDPSGAAGIFRAPTAGGVPTRISTGPYQFPVSIAISDDNATLFVADLAADEALRAGSGTLFRVAVAGGAPTVIATTSRVGPAGIALDGANFLVSALTGTSTPRQSAVLSIPSGGGAGTVLFSAADFSEITSLGVAGQGYATETGLGFESGRVVGFGGATVAGTARYRFNYPAGIARDRSGRRLLIAGAPNDGTVRLTYLDPATGTAEYLTNADFRSPVGAGRASNAAVFAVADERAGASNAGAIFILR